MESCFDDYSESKTYHVEKTIALAMVIFIKIYCLMKLEPKSHKLKESHTKYSQKHTPIQYYRFV